jgi:SAM-dependent methyltransferase
VRAFVLTGAFLLVMTIGGALALRGRPLPIVAGVAIVGALLAAYCFANALLMIWSSRTGKFPVRDRLVEALHLSGAERVLDVGCGRGLVLIEVAKRLTSGRAIGVDLWLAKDLTGNRPDLTLENATAAGVADRVTVETGDMCALPFAAATFDAVASMTAIHNVPSAARRDLALREMARVLKSGGRLAIFDVFYASDYARVLRGAGMEVETSGLYLLWGVPGRCVFARKPGDGVR